MSFCGISKPLFLPWALSLVLSGLTWAFAAEPQGQAIDPSRNKESTDARNASFTGTDLSDDTLSTEQPWHWFNLGLSNHLNQATQPSMTTAIAAYTKAAQGQCAPALVNLGYAYDKGLGVTKDNAKAVEYYRQAAEMGNPVALYNLGRKYFTGTNGLPLDWTAAQRYLEQASEEGLLSAQHLLAQLHHDQNRPTEAATWFTRAAEHGYAPSMCSLAYLFQHGKGLSLDLNRAVQWYQRAAAEDFVPAQYQLGQLYDSGTGVQNSVLAEVYFRKAAERGHREAQYLLGQYYYRGRVVPMDLAEAYRWWTIAETAGLEVASVARRQVSRILSPADLERGQKLVSEYRPIPSTYRETGIAQLHPNARPESNRPTALGAGFVVSEAGHVLTSSFQVPEGTQSLLASLVGGRLKAAPVRIEPMLGVALLRMDTPGRMFQPLMIQTNREQIAPGSWVFCSQLEPSNSARDPLQPVSLRSQISRASGLKADPRHFVLADRLPAGYRGAAVLNADGHLVGLVVNPAPMESEGTGAVVLAARYIRDFLRVAGITPSIAPMTIAKGDAAPMTSPSANNSLVHIAAFTRPLP